MATVPLQTKKIIQRFIPMCRQLATIKKFYKNTNILSHNKKYEVCLDQRKLKTPNGKVFEVSSKPLAIAVATEWDSQKNTIDRSQMHLTALCSTVLDNPNKFSKDDIIHYIVNYLETDTVLFQSNESEELYNLQINKWDPLIQWFCDQYQINITKTQSITPPIVPQETKDLLAKNLSFYNFETLYGLMYGVDTVKSVIVMLAVFERQLGVEEAISITRLEEEYQITHWGTVEWSHELSKQDLQARLAASVLFTYMNSNNSSIVQK